MARFKGCLIHRIKRGGGGNVRRMRCGARGSGSMAGEAVASVLKEEEDARWAKWAKRLNRPTG
jgi:hypothetical protein